jgi:thiamine-phosphate pyrophosphorylase
MNAPIAGLYPILDVGRWTDADGAPAVLDALLGGGAKWVQLRAKALEAGALLALAKDLAPRCKAKGARLIVNDRPDVAMIAGADGVHLGQEDLPPAEVRRWLPKEMIIGVSCHNMDELRRALEDGVADYLAFGPVFPTRSKVRPDPVVGLDGLAMAVFAARPKPIVAIGGVGLGALPSVRHAGASAVAMISELLGAEDIADRTKRAIAAFEI